MTPRKVEDALLDISGQCSCAIDEKPFRDHEAYVADVALKRFELRGPVVELKLYLSWNLGVERSRQNRESNHQCESQSHSVLM